MATSVRDIKDKYPIPVFYYRVTINGEDAIAFSEVSGLSIQYQTITYRDGMSYIDGSIQMPGLRNDITITLKKGVIKGDSYLFNWFNSIRLNTVEKRDIRVDLLNETGEAVVSWIVEDAFPTKLDAPAFNATTNEVAIESLELMARNLKVDYPG